MGKNVLKQKISKTTSYLSHTIDRRNYPRLISFRHTIFATLITNFLRIFLWHCLIGAAIRERITFRTLKDGERLYERGADTGCLYQVLSGFHSLSFPVSKSRLDTLVVSSL